VSIKTVNKKVVFLNTFEPVVPIYRDVFKLLSIKEIIPKALISDCSYRNVEKEIAEDGEWVHMWFPPFLRQSRKLCGVFYWLVSFLVIMVTKSDKFVFLSQPPLFYIAGGLVARFRKIPYCIHVMDMYPNLFYKTTGWWIGGMSKILDPIVNTVFRHADNVIVIGRCMKKIVEEKGVDYNKIEIVENWPEQTISEINGDGSDFRSKYDLNAKKVVMYSGNMGNFHSFESILSVARRVEKRTDIVFVFIGDGVQKKIIQEVAEECKNIILIDFQPVAEFGNILAAGDMHFVSLGAGYEGLMVPSKFYSIIASGKPVIYEGFSGGEVAKVINEEGCGVVVEPGDTDALEKCILRYVSDHNLLIQDGKRARSAYEHRFDRKALISRYTDIITVGLN